MPHLSKTRSNPVVIGGRARISRILRLSCFGVIVSKYGMGRVRTRKASWVADTMPDTNYC